MLNVSQNLSRKVTMHDVENRDFGPEDNDHNRNLSVILARHRSIFKLSGHFVN